MVRENKNTPLSGVIYARYSSHNQKEESIEQQVEECTAFASQNGIEIIHVYADKALSGRTDKRPQFQKMMRDAEKKQFSVVIAYKSNRIARNMLQALNYEDKLSRCGVETLYAKEEFGNTAAGRFALRTMMNVNQFYSENMAEDIRRGMRDNAENCKVNGALPLGYVKGPDGKYAIEPREAEIVREIFRKVLDGVSFVDIANDLNGRGIKTKLGHLWNKNSFHRMLANDVYIGVYRHSGFVKEDGVPPILEKEVFYAMQNHMETKKNPKGRHRESADYLLTGKLYCGYCKSYMVGVSGKTRQGKPQYYYYQCKGRRIEKNCNKENVRKEWIERKVAELTKQYILTDETIEWIADNAVSFQLKAQHELKISSIEDEIAENKKALKNVMTAIEQGIITDTTRERLLELEANIKDLEQSLAIAKAANQPVQKERIIYTLEQLRSGNPESISYQKLLIDTFVKAVYLWDDKLEIDYYYTNRKNQIKYNFSEGSQCDNCVDGPICEVRTSSPEPHQQKSTHKRAFLQ